MGDGENWRRKGSHFLHTYTIPRLLHTRRSSQTHTNKHFRGLLEITGDYWRLLGITGDYWGLLGITGDYWRLLGITGVYWR